MQQENRPINVNFPNKLKVESPEIESINSTATRISNWLHYDLRKIIEPLTVLKFVPDLIKELRTTTVEQFTNLFQGQVETDVINRQANIKVLSKKINSSKLHIKQKEENLEKTIRNISSRYSELSNQLNNEHEMFLYKLDNHAYDIIEKTYPLQIQNKFSYESLPGLDFLTEHAKNTVTNREYCIDKGFQETATLVNTFLDTNNEFINELEKLSCDSLDVGMYDLSYCFIELKNNSTGDKRIECWFNCEIIEKKKNPNLNAFREEAEYRIKHCKATKNNNIINNLEIKESLNKTQQQRLYSDLKIKFN